MFRPKDPIWRSLLRCPLKPVSIRPVLRPLRTYTSRSTDQFSFARINHVRSAKWGVFGVSCGLIVYSYSTLRISNEESQSVEQAKHIFNPHNLLEPDPDADTFEMGLYSSSQKEEESEKARYRVSRTHNHPLSWLYRLGFLIQDCILDPLITLGRFVELSAIFLPIILTIPIGWFGKRDKSNIRSGSRLWFKIVRHALELAGASFIKLGQWAASRTDIFPREMCDELGNLHSNAKAHSLRDTKRIVAATFGMPFEEIFEEFIEKPVGVGAIAQVYIAKLSTKILESHKEEEEESHKKNLIDKVSEKIITYENPAVNQWVAVKVLHPKVERKIMRDLRIMSFFANLIDIIPTMEWLSLPDEVDQFSILMNLQLDLRIEGLNLRTFRRNFKDRLDIKFPKPYLNFTSREILVEEFIHAIPMSKILEISDNFGKGLSKEISDKGLDAFLQMLILDNFVHADLHPGNMMIRFYKNDLFPHQKEYRIVKSSNEADSNKITNELLSLGDDYQKWVVKLTKLYEEGYHAEVCFLDAGLVTELNDKDRYNFIDLFNALSEFDGYKAGELMIERSRTPETAIDKELFALKVDKLVDRMKKRTFALGNISIGDLLDQVLSMVRQHHVRMEGDFVTMVVAILLLEGVGRQLDPELDLFARQLGIQDGAKLLKNSNTLSMIKVWLALEVRQFIHASIQDIHKLVQSDGLSPNV